MTRDTASLTDNSRLQLRFHPWPENIEETVIKYVDFLSSRGVAPTPNRVSCDTFAQSRYPRRMSSSTWSSSTRGVGGRQLTPHIRPKGITCSPFMKMKLTVLSEDWVKLILLLECFSWSKSAVFMIRNN